MFGQNWNEVVNEGNPAVYLRLKSSVGSYLQHQPAPRVTLHSLLFPEIRIKSKMMIKTIMKMILMISSISEMISFGGGVIPGGPRDPVGEHLYLPFTPPPSSSLLSTSLSSSSSPSSSSSSPSSSSPSSSLLQPAGIIFFENIAQRPFS